MGIKRSSQHLVLVAIWGVLFLVGYLSLSPSREGVAFIKNPFRRSSIRPRYIFVDLGANIGDSLDAFLRKEDAKFQYEFPRPDWARYEEADIYLFEGNPTFNPALVEAKQRHRSRGVNVNIFPSTVVDVRDGTRMFYLDTINDEHDYWGSSIYANHPDAVDSGSNGTELTAINISRWLLMNTLPHDFVVVKMDIEGSEYDVIPHMAEMRAWTVIDHLLVEWHSGLHDGDAVRRAEMGMKKLVAEGVNMPEYDSPA
ncbi:methyltransferase FkbM domain protein [Metarhizium robertsii]|uniref:Methyltransferase FkbM domain protein n=1 Tax=Metarhizium robertsii TaxID=568076 RepID=A0A0A1UP70_9HYPO|nr:methyltransferase FkbM domain protein [Metarhizium robertsii]